MTLLIRSVPTTERHRSFLAQSCPTFAWRQDDFSLLGFGKAWRFDPGVGGGRFLRAQNAWNEWLSEAEVDDQVGVSGSGPVGFGSFTFDSGAKGSLVAVPEVLVGHRGAQSWVTTVGDADPVQLKPCPHRGDAPDRPRYGGSTRPDWEWMEAVSQALERISSGSLQKVVLARDISVWSKTPFDVRLLLDRLHRANPQCFTFAVEGLVGASPELLLRQQDRHVQSVTLAGTASRHVDPKRDSQMAQQLLDSEKDRREHALAVSSVEKVLMPRCSRLERPERPGLQELANLWHLATSFAGILSQPMSCFEVLELLHPTAAVGGVPRDAALAAIADLEGMRRGGYAGPVGWFDRSCNGEWAIALRCAQLEETGARLFAGSGIVAGSFPEEELGETRLKLRAMTEALDLR